MYLGLERWCIYYYYAPRKINRDPIHPQKIVGLDSSASSSTFDLGGSYSSVGGGNSAVKIPHAKNSFVD